MLVAKLAPKRPRKPHQGSLRAPDDRGPRRATTLVAHLTVFICSLRWWGVAETPPPLLWAVGVGVVCVGVGGRPSFAPPHKGAVPASARPASIMHPLLRATC